MKIYLIGLKNHPEYYIGKENPTYALASDEQLDNEIQHNAKHGKEFRRMDILIREEKDVAHWFVKRKRAKLWTDGVLVKKFVNRYNKGKTHSEYEVEIDHGSNIYRIPLDEFINGFY